MVSQKRYNRLLSKYYSSDIYFWEWIIAAVIILVTLSSCTYKDTISLTVWSTNLWDVIAQGHLFDFYEYTANNIYDLPHDKMGCDLIAIIPMSIWNIPIWIMQYFFHKNIVDNPVMIAWSKLGLVLFTGAVSFMAYKIAYLLVADKKRCLWASILTLSSTVAIESICAAGQNDVFFILYGAVSVYYMMKGCGKRAIFFTALSVAVKPFFIFAYLPLVLYMEKNLFKAAGKCLLSVSLMVIGRIIGLAFPMYGESMSNGPSYAIMYQLLDVGIETSGGKASAFLIGLMAVCFAAYMTGTKDEEERKKYILYITAFVFLLISVFSYTDFYRSYLVMPYLSVLVVTNIEKFRVDLFLMYVFQFFRMAAVAAKTSNGLSITSMKGTVLSMISEGSGFSEQSSASLKWLLYHINPRLPGFMCGAASSLFVISAIILLIINYPKFKYSFYLEDEGIFKKYDHGLLLLNITSFLPYLCMMYFLYFYPVSNITFKIVEP